MQFEKVSFKCKDSVSGKTVAGDAWIKKEYSVFLWLTLVDSEHNSMKSQMFLCIKKLFLH